MKFMFVNAITLLNIVICKHVIDNDKPDNNKEASHLLEYDSIYIGK
jgi:hypothetical protein